MTRNLSVLVVLLGVVALMPAQALAGGDIFADLSLDAACAKAGETDKLVVVDFIATWCGPCKMMDKETWPNEEVMAWINKNAVAIKIDVDKETALAKRFNVTAMPTIVFVKPDQAEISRFVGGYPASEFLKFANQVLSGDAPPPGGQGQTAGDSSSQWGRSSIPTPSLAKVPSVSGLSASGTYWRWVAMFGFAALVSLSCFKNPKRSHNN